MADFLLVAVLVDGLVGAEFGLCGEVEEWSSEVGYAGGLDAK